MSNRPGLTGFLPPVPPRRSCLAQALTGLARLAGANQPQPAKGNLPPAAKKPRPVTLRPTRQRVNALWIRLATAALAGVGVVLVWQLIDRRSVVRSSLRSIRSRIQGSPGRPNDIAAPVPWIVHKQQRQARR